ncbi:MAG: dethiobiotin synthase [Bacteroidetes bacterium]|nr:dethiobiotin synthase [Bacteroidota bacterium]
MNALFVTGTDTGVGKTLVSAILVKALSASYWKPVQSGLDDGTDTSLVQTLCGEGTHCFPEAYRLHMPASPHAAAAAESKRIALADLVLPLAAGPLVVEGAGGILVPLNDEELFADWVQQQGLPVVLVSLNRLGSINHTLLSVEALMNRHLDILGIVFNGDEVPATERFILEYTSLPMLARVPWVAKPDAAFVDEQARLIRPAFDSWFRMNPEGSMGVGDGVSFEPM